MPIDPDEIASAIGAYNATGRKPLLAVADAIRLLAVMFADADVCRRNLDSLVAEGFSRRTLATLLPILIETGLISKERGRGRASNTYQLHLPRRQP